MTFIAEAPTALWYFPSEYRYWVPSGDVQADRAVIMAREDAINVTPIPEGCPVCLCGRSDIFADPVFNCYLCGGTGYPQPSPPGEPRSVHMSRRVC